MSSTDNAIIKQAPPQMDGLGHANAKPPARSADPLPTRPSAVSPSKPDIKPPHPAIVITNLWRPRRNRWIAAVTVLAIIVGGLGAWLLAAHHHRPAPHHVAAAVAPKPAPPLPTYAPLTGLPADPASAKQPVIGVMIENLYPNARPQSGLGQAGIVYETLAEGGITRFLALFQEPLPSVIGPVRSLRPYFLDWGLEYGVPVAHAGGSQPALAQVQPLGLKDINALAYDGSAFYRTRDRLAPHNLYTNAQLLAQLDSRLGFATPPAFTPLPRKADQPEPQPTHPAIHINFSSTYYAAEYHYNPQTDGYSRFMAGTPHIDKNNGQQIGVKNIVVEYVPTSYSIQPDGKPQTNLGIVGRGQALVFMDGGVTLGTWNKASDSAPTQLLDGAGHPIPLNRGNTWFEVVPNGNAVSY